MKSRIDEFLTANTAGHVTDGMEKMRDKIDFDTARAFPKGGFAIRSSGETIGIDKDYLWSAGTTPTRSVHTVRDSIDEKIAYHKNQVDFHGAFLSKLKLQKEQLGSVLDMKLDELQEIIGR